MQFSFVSSHWGGMSCQPFTVSVWMLFLFVCLFLLSSWLANCKGIFPRTGPRQKKIAIQKQAVRQLLLTPLRFSVMGARPEGCWQCGWSAPRASGPGRRARRSGRCVRGPAGPCLCSAAVFISAAKFSLWLIGAADESTRCPQAPALHLPSRRLPRSRPPRAHPFPSAPGYFSCKNF